MYRLVLPRLVPKSNRVLEWDQVWPSACSDCVAGVIPPGLNSIALPRQSFAPRHTTIRGFLSALFAKTVRAATADFGDVSAFS